MAIKSEHEDDFKKSRLEEKQILVTMEYRYKMIYGERHTSKKAGASDKLHFSETFSFVTLRLSGKPETRYENLFHKKH